MDGYDDDIDYSVYEREYYSDDDDYNSVDEGYINNTMSDNKLVTKENVVAFSSVIDIYEKTGDKIKTLEAFDDFIMPIAASDPRHAQMISGFFCGLLGKNMSLSDKEINTLSEKYKSIIMQQIKEREEGLTKDE